MKPGEVAGLAGQSSVGHSHAALGRPLAPQASSRRAALSVTVARTLGGVTGA